jgi:surfeit locus 1 family protein
VSPSRGRFLVPAITVVALLAVRLGLGTWQVYRLQWKTAILERIAQAEQESPVALRPDPQPYTKVTVTGRFRFDLASQFGAEVRDTSIGPTMGSYQIVPLQRDDEPPILVDRGWLPQQRDTALDDPAGLVNVTGYIRATPMPFTLIALGSPSPKSYPIPAQHLPRPPNNHLSYAITWYGLALALIVIFIVWARKPLST